jgi:hypothetical protein
MYWLDMEATRIEARPVPTAGTREPRKFLAIRT